MEFRRRIGALSVMLVAAAAQLSAAVFGVSVLLAPAPTDAAQTVPYKINFQGRLTDNSGNALADGLYNIKFRLWTASTSGTNVWEGDRVRGASDFRVQVTNGLFNIQFGDTTLGDPALSPTLFSSGTYPLYLEVELPTPASATCATNGCAVFTEGAMTPRQPLASTPYAFSADTLDGLDSSAFGQLSAIQSWTDTNTFSKSGGAAIVLSGTAAAGGSILQIGSALSGGSGSGTLFGANTTSAADLINLQVSGGLRLKVDNSGNLTAGGNVSLAAGGSRSLAVAQAASGAGNSLTLAAGQSGSGGFNGGDLVLQAGATGGSGTTGSVIVRANGTESATAFQIQQATSAPAFTVDTAANKVVVGDATGTDAATTLLVVDSATVDPATGYNGAQYYNTTSGKFRCYQAGAWTDCITGTVTATANSTASFVSGLANVAGTGTGVAVETLVFTSATAVSNTAGATGFTAPAAGSFRSCLTKNNAAITGGSMSVRWRVNGVSVGAAACTMNTANSRSAATALDTGTVTFAAGDTIGIAYDSSGLLPAASNDFTTYWSVEYNASSGNGLTLQFIYDNSNSPAGITLSNAKDLAVTAADTATDPNIVFNLQCATSCGANGRFAVQNNGTDALTVSPNGGGIALGQDTTLQAGKNLILSNGTGGISQTFSNNAASSAQTISIANTNTGAGVTIQGLNLTPTNTAAASSGTNTLNVINFAAGGALGGTDTTNGLNFASSTGYTNFINTPTYDLSSLGDQTAAFTALNGTSTANGAGTNATSLILASATNFDIGNYVQVNSANCGGAGVNPCYAKITNKVTNTLTITPALTWANGSTVNEYHIPEIGGTGLTQTLANRFGRGYFIAGVGTGNGTTYYNEDGIDSSLSTFNLLASNVTTLNIGGAATNLTLGSAGTTVTVPGNLSTSGTGSIASAGAISAPTSTNTINGIVINSGTISTGTWQGTAVGAQYGGTGQSSYAVGDLLYASTTTGLSRLAAVATGSCLISQGVSTAPVWGACAAGSASTTLNNLGTTSINAALTPASNNSIDLGTAAAIWRNLYVANIDAGTTTTTLTVGTAATTTAVTIGRSGFQVSLPGGISSSGNFTTSGNISATGSGTLSSAGAITGPTVTNTINGLIINSGALSGVGNITGSGAVMLASGGAGALTLDSASNTLVIAATDTTLQRTATGTYTINLVDTGATTLAVTNSGTGVASLSVEGGVNIGSGQTYQVNGAQISSANLSNDSAITKQGNAFNGTSQLVQTNGSGALPALSGANLTSLNPSNLTTGTAAVTLQPAASAALALTATGTGAINITPGTGGLVNNLASGVGATYTATAAQTADLLTLSNTAGFAPTADGINLLEQTFYGKPSGTNLESATRINVTNANTATGGQVQGLRIVATGTGGAINSDTTGILIDALVNASTGTTNENALEIGAGWDAGLFIQSGGNVIKTSTDTQYAFDVQNSAGSRIFTVDTESSTDPLEVQVGMSSTIDAIQVNLGLDSSNVFAETQTCTTTSNQGALYYNTATNAIRSCVNGGWEDVVTTGGLGILAYGVIADTGTIPGNIAGKASTTAASGPCKVGWASTTSVAYTACSAYSGGRKVVVTAGTITGITNTNGTWTHICLSSTTGQPVKSTAGTEVANLTTAPIAFSAASPVVCLADIKGTGTNIQIYDTRVFTNSVKAFAYSSSTLGLGMIGKASTDTIALPGTGANNSSLRGVVVATNGAAWTAGNGPNAIIVIGGAAWVKATAGTAGANVTSSTGTNGYAFTGTSTGIYGLLGMAETGYTTTCTNGANCNLSLLLTVNPK